METPAIVRTDDPLVVLATWGKPCTLHIMNYEIPETIPVVRVDISAIMSLAMKSPKSMV